MQKQSEILETCWETHMHAEFVLKDVDAIMQTMVAEPIVNHVPTLTGGVGYDEVYYFYKNYFIPKIPSDIQIRCITRVMDANHLVDEFIVSFTHDREIDFMLPGIAVTGKYIELPHVAIIYFEENKISAEHIYWDHASLLAQLELLDNQKLPVASVEEARKLLDKTIPSNGLIKRLNNK